MEGGHELSLYGGEDRVGSVFPQKLAFRVDGTCDVGQQGSIVPLLDVCRPVFLPAVSQRGPCSHHPPAPRASTSGDGPLLSS